MARDARTRSSTLVFVLGTVSYRGWSLPSRRSSLAPRRFRSGSFGFGNPHLGIRLVSCGRDVSCARSGSSRCLPRCFGLAVFFVLAVFVTVTTLRLILRIMAFVLPPSAVPVPSAPTSWRLKATRVQCAGSQDPSPHSSQRDEELRRFETSTNATGGTQQGRLDYARLQPSSTSGTATTRSQACACRQAQRSQQGE